MIRGEKDIDEAIELGLLLQKEGSQSKIIIAGKLINSAELSEILDTIDELDLTEFDFKNNTLPEIISKFPNLRSLDLSNTEIGNDDLLALEKNQKLEILDISGTKVSNLSALSELSKLNHLMAYDTEIDDLSPLENLSLIKIEMGRAKITDLTPLRSMLALETIIMQGNDRLMFLEPLSHLKQLKKLDVKDTAVGANELSKLENLPNLVELDVNVDIEFAAEAVLRSIANNFQRNELVPTLFNSASSFPFSKGSNEKDEKSKIMEIASSEKFRSDLMEFLKRHNISIDETSELKTTLDLVEFL